MSNYSCIVICNHCHRIRKVEADTIIMCDGNGDPGTSVRHFGSWQTNRKQWDTLQEVLPGLKYSKSRNCATDFGH